MNTSDIIAHYDLLIDENNDPVHDPEPLRSYMDKWDGQPFIDKMQLDNTKSVLEIGVGTGRLALRTAPLCHTFTGIDLSPKTIDRAKENLRYIPNVTLINADFITHVFPRKFDVIYSSLTFMHIQNKQSAITKISSLLTDNGKLLLSIDKNPSDFIDTGTSKLKIYPDVPAEILSCLNYAKLTLTEQYETDFAIIFAAAKE